MCCLQQCCIKTNIFHICIPQDELAISTMKISGKYCIHIFCTTLFSCITQKTPNMLVFQGCDSIIYYLQRYVYVVSHSHSGHNSDQMYILTPCLWQMLDNSTLGEVASFTETSQEVIGIRMFIYEGALSKKRHRFYQFSLYNPKNYLITCHNTVMTVL